MKYFERKDKPDDNINHYLNAFQFKEYPVNIKGSSMLAENKYFGDYDLYSYIGNFHHYTTHITKAHTVDELYQEFTNILNNLGTIKDSFFVEFKVGNAEGEHEIIHHLEKFTKQKFKSLLEKFKPLDFIQIEYINYIGDRFITMTSDYFFHTKPTYTKTIKDLKTAIESLLEKGNYYKVLKRLFNMFQTKAEHNKKFEKHNVKYLVDFFNSKIGQMVVVEANLKAILKVRELYVKNPRVLELSKLNLKKLGYKQNDNLNTIRKNINLLNTIINVESKKIFVETL